MLYPFFLFYYVYNFPLLSILKSVELNEKENKSVLEKSLCFLFGEKKKKNTLKDIFTNQFSFFPPSPNESIRK